MADRTLVMMRHAKSSWENDVKDMDRPLSKRGERDAEAAGKELLARGLRFDVALVSPAARAQQTWAGLHKAGVEAGDVRTEPRIYDHDAEAVVAAVRELDDSVRTVLVIGHSPTVPEVVRTLAAAADSKDWYAFDTKVPTASIAVIEVDGDWASVGDPQGALSAFIVPRG